MELATNAIRIEAPNPGFWSRVKITFLMIGRRRSSLWLHAIIPLLGVLVFLAAVVTGRALAIAFALLAICLLITPMFVLLTVALSFLSYGRRSYTYCFDDAGIHVYAGSYEVTRKWHAISTIHRIGGFMWFFSGSEASYIIPLQAFASPGIESAIFELAKKHRVITP